MNPPTRTNRHSARAKRASAVPAPRVFVLGNFVQACCWMVERLPLAGETFRANALIVEPGGKGLNVAVALARLGVRVETLIGCGTDSAAQSLHALLARERVGTRHVHAFAGASGWGAGLIGADGRNAIAVYLGANEQLRPAHARAAADDIAAAHLVYGQLETSLSAVTEAFVRAHRAGVCTVLNPSPWRELPARLRRTTHTVIANEVEVAAMLGLPERAAGVMDATDLARDIRAQLPAFARDWPRAQRLVVTVGAKGSLGFERSEDVKGAWNGWHAPALPIHAVDTVGAGDAFATGYCAALLAGRPLAEALGWGNRCGARLASRPGVLDALPHGDWLARAVRGVKPALPI